MNFTCNNCQKRYSIADEKVRGKTVKVRCKNCQSVISVEGPQLPLEESTRVVSLADVERLRAQERSLAEPESGGAAAPVVSSPVVTAPPAAKAPLAPQMPWDDEPTRAAPLRAPASPWFVMVRNKQEGPLDEAGLRELIDNGSVSGRSFFWQQGMADWKRGTDVPELAGLFAPPPEPEPPLPPPPPLMEEPEQPTTPGRASRGAVARREPEPQAFMPEPEPPPEQEQPEPQPQAWAQELEPQQQAWAPEEHQQDTAEQAYYQEPVARAQPQQGRRGHAANAGPLNDDQLFSDLDLPDNRNGGNPADHEENYPAGANWTEEDERLAAQQGGDDEGEPPAPVDDKHRASVKKKAPAPRRGSAGKKVALSLLLLLVLLVGGAFVLDMLNVVPLRVKTVDAQGNPVERSFFSAEGMNALMGRAPPAPKAAPVAPAKTPEAAPAQPEPTAPAAGAGTESGAAAAPADGTKQAAQDAAPSKGGEGAEAGKAAAAAPLADSPSDEEVERVVEQAQASFRECVQAELKKNPAFRGGKVTLTATVGNTGAVKEAVLSRKGMDRTPVGTCLRERAKGMVFSPFAGEDVDLDIEVDLSKKSL